MSLLVEYLNHWPIKYLDVCQVDKKRVLNYNLNKKLEFY